MCKVIREASPEDAPFIVDMIRAGANEGVYHTNGCSLSVEEFQKYALESPAKGYLLMVCQLESGIVGYVDSRVRRGVGHILGLYVKPTHRKKGIGKKLMEKTLESFRKRKCHKARLEVFADNHEAIDFYTRFNFVREGLLHKDEEKRDVIIASRFL